MVLLWKINVVGQQRFEINQRISELFDST